MVTELQILSSGFWGSILGPKYRRKNKVYPNILGVASGYESLHYHANHANPKKIMGIE